MNLTNKTSLIFNNLRSLEFIATKFIDTINFIVLLKNKVMALCDLGPYP